MSVAEKRAALAIAANGAPVVSKGKAKYRVGSALVHVRFCSENVEAPAKFKFNINPNTLTAEYELWVCGSAAYYYLVPISFIRDIYDDPNTYEDRHHPGIKVVSVDADSHRVTYASGGVCAGLRSFFRATLPMS